MFGDRLQKGVTKQGMPHNLESCVKTQTPTLESSMRANNNHIKDNTSLTITAASVVVKGQESGLDANTVESNYQNAIGMMDFTYHDTDGQFTGHKIVESITEADVLSIIECNYKGR